MPSHIVTSLDDPIIPVRGLAALARPPALSITVTRYGGHCGFFEQLRGPTWVERRILTLLGADIPQRHRPPREAAMELPEGR